MYILQVALGQSLVQDTQFSPIIESHIESPQCAVKCHENISARRKERPKERKVSRNEVVIHVQIVPFLYVPIGHLPHVILLLVSLQLTL